MKKRKGMSMLLVLTIVLLLSSCAADAANKTFQIDSLKHTFMAAIVTKKVKYILNPYKKRGARHASSAPSAKRASI